MSVKRKVGSMKEVNPEELTPTPEIDLATIKGRAVKGIAALTGRTFILQAVAFIGFFLLSVLLDAAEIGLFFAI